MHWRDGAAHLAEEGRAGVKTRIATTVTTQIIRTGPTSPTVRREPSSGRRTSRPEESWTMYSSKTYASRVDKSRTRRRRCVLLLSTLSERLFVHGFI